MTDADLIALCAFEEADLEPDDGVAAVVRVIKNRIARRYQSDGTVPNTVFHGNGVAFSWAAFAMVHGKYRRVADGPEQIASRAAGLLADAKRFPKAWARVDRISQAVMAGTYEGDDYAKVADDTVLYLNPAISQAAWAVPAKEVCQIGHHTFSEHKPARPAGRPSQSLSGKSPERLPYRLPVQFCLDWRREFVVEAVR